MDKTQLDSQIKGGKIAYEILEELTGIIKPGVNILELNKFAAEKIERSGCTPAFQGYKGYPDATCICVNEEIVHGIPRDYELQDGDVVTVDLGVTCNGWLVDTARTYPVGQISKTDQQLLDSTKNALDEAIKICRPGIKTGDIGSLVESLIKRDGFAIIKELSGHGVGRTLQEPPSVPNYGRPGTGTVLKEGMVIAIEPITALKPTKIAILDDGWTIMAEQGITTAQFEHTVAITNDGAVVLTGI